MLLTDSLVSKCPCLLASVHRFTAKDKTGSCDISPWMIRWLNKSKASDDCLFKH